MSSFLNYVKQYFREYSLIFYIQSDMEYLGRVTWNIMDQMEDLICWLDLNKTPQHQFWTHIHHEYTYQLLINLPLFTFSGKRLQSKVESFVARLNFFSVLIEHVEVTFLYIKLLLTQQ